MNTILNLFPIKIYKTFYQDTAELLKSLNDELLEILKNTNSKNNQNSMQDGTLCTFNHASDLNQSPKLENLITFAEKHANEYWKVLNFHENLKPKIFQIWANSTPKGGWIRSHSHGVVPLTGVLYLNSSPAHGNLIIENPMDQILMSQPLKYDIHDVYESIDVSSGDLVIFPGWMRHRVEKNTLDDERVILGMNFASIGQQYVAGQWAQS